VKRKILPCLAACAIMVTGACASRGKEVFVRERCGFCHRFRELGGGGAPDLSEIGSRHAAAWIGLKINDPAALNPTTRMPSFQRIRGFDLRSLVAFLRG
jgi:cbb3-type cytochrome oxidase cytochrome c subunit